jgi:GAF domain-containing protein/HAMP domain-containing protein
MSTPPLPEKQNLPETSEGFYRIDQKEALVEVVFSTGLISGILGLLFLSYALGTGALFLQGIILASAFLFASLVTIISYYSNIFKDINTKMFVMMGFIEIALLLLSLLVSNIALGAALVILIVSTVIGSSVIINKRSDTFITIGLFSAILNTLSGTFSPFYQISIPNQEYYIPSILGALGVVYVVLVGLQIAYTNSLRIKLLIGALAVVLAPLISLYAVTNMYTQSSLATESYKNLQLAASFTSSKIDEFIDSNRNAISADATLPSVVNYLSQPAIVRKGGLAEQDLALTFNALQKSRSLTYLLDYGLVDDTGIVNYDINSSRIGKKEVDELYFAVSYRTGRPYVSSVQFEPSGTSYILFSAPVIDRNLRTVGVIRARYNATIFQSILEQNSNLAGALSYAMLVDENFLRLGDTSATADVGKTVVPLPISIVVRLQSENRLPVYNTLYLSTNLVDLGNALRNYQEKPYFTGELHALNNRHLENGAIVKMNNKSWLVVYSQDKSLIEASFVQQNRISILIVSLIAAAIGIFVTFITRAFSDPILQLTETAKRIAVGDLTARANIKSEDEIGILAQTFDTMTAELSGLITGLESRVEERTHELATQNEFLTFRSRQLQTVSDVARSVASTQSLDSLLTKVTELISERFNYYHVGIFLNDEKNEFAVLRSANSEGGKRMLARSHKLKVGQVGIVGYVTGTGNPRIATDVGEDAVHFKNPDLPYTRSEMALPLKIGDKIIGALDIQSTESNAFTAENIELFNILADQVAIAIDNNRLYEETTQALEDMQKIHKQYLRSEWSKLPQQQTTNAFLYANGKVKAQEEILTPDIQQAIDSGEIIRNDITTNAASPSVAVPIMLRGERIGVIRLQDTVKSERVWSDDEITAIQSISDQIAQALENARLFSQTIRRAERERRVLEITSKIRSVNDPQAMIQIATQELQRALNARAQIILPQSTTQNASPEIQQEHAEINLQDNNGHSANLDTAESSQASELKEG